MTGSIKSWLISGGSMLAGVFCVVAIWWSVPQEDDKTVQNKLRFSQLSGREQADLRNKARAFVDSTNESELTRLQQIHVAVNSDPKLLTRLESLDGLLANLDLDVKSKLNPNGKFAEDWAQQIQTLAKDKHAGDVTYEFPIQVLLHWRTQGPRVAVNGYEYEAFLDQVSAEDWGSNEEYNKFIDGQDRTTRRMFKTLAVAERSMQDDTGELNKSILALAKKLLVPADAHQEEYEGLPENSPGDDGDDERAEEREKIRSQLVQIEANLQAAKLLEYGLKNTGREFLSRMARETVSPQVFTENFKRSEQIRLMTMTPADATQELSARLVKESNLQNPEFARINAVLAEATSQISEHAKPLWAEYWNIRRRGGSWRGREGGRDGRGRDEDGRGGDGRSPRRPDERGSGERGPNERGPGERNQGDRGRGPGGPGGRGTGGPRFDDDRGQNGPARSGPDNRYSGDPQRDNRRPNEDRPPEQSGKR